MGRSNHMRKFVSCFAIHTPSGCRSFVKKCWSKWADELVDTLKSLKNGRLHFYPSGRDRNWCRQDGATYPGRYRGYLREAEKCIEACFRQRLPTVVGSDKQTKLVVIPSPKQYHAAIRRKYQGGPWFAQTDNVVQLLANAILGTYPGLAGYCITPVLVFWTLRAVYLGFWRLWTGFELSSSWRRLLLWRFNESKWFGFYEVNSHLPRGTESQRFQRPKYFSKNS
jgi:hypothetical protein